MSKYRLRYLELGFKKFIISWNIVLNEIKVTYKLKVLRCESGSNRDGEK